MFHGWPLVLHHLIHTHCSLTTAYTATHFQFSTTEVYAITCVILTAISQGSPKVKPPLQPPSLSLSPINPRLLSVQGHPSPSWWSPIELTAPPSWPQWESHRSPSSFVAIHRNSPARGHAKMPHKAALTVRTRVHWLVPPWDWHWNGNTWLVLWCDHIAGEIFLLDIIY